MTTGKTALSLIMGASFLLGGTTAVVAADGAALAEKCERCHGKNGNSEKDQVPNIAGFSSAYFVSTMEDYQKGDRPGKEFETEGHEKTDMNAIAKKFSKEELEALGEFFAKHTFQAHEQETDPKLVKKGKKLYKKRKCKKCHTENGSEADDDAGILAGQWMPYLQSQFDQFKEGKRTQPKKMKKRFDKLEEGDIPALIHFFASQK
jgi:sulfide dehydrogenase cytochrome subunit